MIQVTKHRKKKKRKTKHKNVTRVRKISVGSVYTYDIVRAELGPRASAAKCQLRRHATYVEPRARDCVYARRAYYFIADAREVILFNLF